MDKTSTYLREMRERFPLVKLQNLFNQLEDKKVLVIGDTIIDEYCFVVPKGRAMKDPMLSVRFLKEEIYAGGILAIANHLSTFIKDIHLVTLLGGNMDRKDFILSELKKNIKPLFFEKAGAPTIRKKRYINSARNEKLFKVEYLNDKPIDQNLENDILSFLGREVPKFDIVLLGDFGHGFITPKILRLLEEKSKYLAVNVQTNSANLGFNLVTKLNSPSFFSLDGYELSFATGDNFSSRFVQIKKLNRLKGFKRFLVTLGNEGAAYFDDGHIYTGPALTDKVTDVVGAGDAAFSITSLLSLLSQDKNLVPFLANCVGAIKINIMGNKESVTRDSLLRLIDKQYKLVEEAEITQYFGSINKALNTIRKEDVRKFTDFLIGAYYNKKHIYIFGNGGSAATASHFCGDLVKGASYGLNKRFKAICLNDNTPALMAIANDISYDDIFVEQLKNFLKKDDLVIGISGSGNSNNIIKALQYAKKAGAKTVAICGFKGGKIKELADLSIHAEVDDMEVSEDIHNLVIVHCVKRILTNILSNGNGDSSHGQKYMDRIGVGQKTNLYDSNQTL